MSSPGQRKPPCSTAGSSAASSGPVESAASARFSADGLAASLGFSSIVSEAAAADGASALRLSVASSAGMETRRSVGVKATVSSGSGARSASSWPGCASAMGSCGLGEPVKSSSAREAPASDCSPTGWVDLTSATVAAVSVSLGIASKGSRRSSIGFGLSLTGGPSNSSNLSSIGSGSSLTGGPSIFSSCSSMG